jgi:hypothetical protein
MSRTIQDRVLAAWSERDQRAALSVGDHDVIRNSVSLRRLIIDLALRNPVDDDLYDACAGLGRLIAQQNGSPSLASATIHHACDALDSVAAPWLAGARAALYEAFSASLVEMARAEAIKGWEFPGCAVDVGDRTVAIAAGHPGGEPEELQAWAGRTAKAAARRGVRRAIVDGPDAPRAAMVEALAVLGIEVVSRTT